MPWGGYIVIDETEALISIDVNTGRNRGGKNNSDKMILETNLQAADEVARQLRLRNIGGLIVLDFIDMKGPRDRREVYNRMRDGLRKDKSKTHVLPISIFSLEAVAPTHKVEFEPFWSYAACDDPRAHGHSGPLDT